jgi:hypothetical protein
VNFNRTQFVTTYNHRKDDSSNICTTKLEVAQYINSLIFNKDDIFYISLEIKETINHVHKDLLN